MAVTVAWCGRGSATFGLALFLLFRRLIRDIEDTLGTLQADALERRLDLDARRVDDLGLVDEVDADLLSALHARTRLGGDAGAEGTNVTAVDALTVLEQANEHLRSTVKYRLDIGRRDRRLVRNELDELLKLDVRMQVNGGVLEGFSGLVEADFTLNSFDLDHDRLIYCQTMC